jgi:phage baseplate assembly protein W
MPVFPGIGTVTFPTSVPGNPSLPTYGHDLSCTNDLDPNMIEVDGLTTLTQAIFRRLITPRGTLLDDPNYGYDVTQFVNDDLSPADISRIGTQIDQELLKDQRVYASSTTVTYVASASMLTIATVVTPSTGPTFTLVLAASQVTVQLLAPSIS